MFIGTEYRNVYWYRIQKCLLVNTEMFIGKIVRIGLNFKFPAQIVVLYDGL